MSRPQPQRGPSRYGGGAAHWQGQLPAAAEGSAARPFFPAPGGGEPLPSAVMGAPRQQHHHHQQYAGGGGGGAKISLGHGHGEHHYHQFGLEARDDGGGSGSGVPGLLPRHSSSPPVFFSSRVVDDNNGFASARSGAAGGEVRHAMNNGKKMKSPLNYSRQGTLSQISEDGIPDLTDNFYGSDQSKENFVTDHVARSFSGGFSIRPWEDSNSIVFSTPTGKPGMHNNDDVIASLSNYETQFIIPREMAGADKYLQMQQDQVPFRVRAKRGCATHPRSIAERERRTRISEKLRKLQALVPNMDKQTSTSDMLDLAVEHIRGLQNQLQALKEDKEKCTCRGKQTSRN